MKNVRSRLFHAVFTAIVFGGVGWCFGEGNSARFEFAVELLKTACKEKGCEIAIGAGTARKAGIALRLDASLKPEHFAISRKGDGGLTIRGGDDSGLLYGCQELARRVLEAGRLPETLELADGPEFKMRGACIGMQRLKASKGGNYLWPYTPENFPFFYDKAQWTRYLDFLLENRMNSLYLWNGHPFASLVELPDYPEAAEVTPEVMKQNREMMLWLTRECDKRGIWLLQMFYNIHLPAGLAKKHGLSTSLEKSTPVAADYTRKALAKFVQDYPSVGLLVCLGEALDGRENQVEWFTQTIIPGILQGLKARGWSDADLADKDKLPPLVVRGHHIVEQGSHKDVFGEGIKLYPNLMSMAKFNGESLTTWEPRGNYQQFHKDLAAYSDTHIANVHLMSNLEPFRYADFSFIWQSVRAIRDRLDGNGVHLYPRNYWDWPNAPDDVPGLQQLDRDQLWFETWARYAWKIDRDPAGEKEYWIGKLEKTYGTRSAAEKIYAAYDAAGECAPRLLRRFGITGGNRQSLCLGMTLDQLSRPKKYGVWKDLRASDSPPGEDIREYIEKEWKKLAHAGETPPEIVRDAREFARAAVEAIEAAAPNVTRNKEEFERLRNDIHSTQELTEHITQMAEAALLVVRNEFSNEPGDLDKALTHVEASVAAYRRLAEKAGPAYRYGPGYHGRQNIPFNRVWHWSQLVEKYQAELDGFRQRVDVLAGRVKVQAETPDIKPLPAAAFKLLSSDMQTYTVEPGAKVFSDQDYALSAVAPELKGLTGIRFSHKKSTTGQDVVVEIENEKPVKVLIGYFDGAGSSWLKVPNLEHVAHADDRGGHETKLFGAAVIQNSKALTEAALPRVNIHAFRYEAGRNKIEMIGKGAYVILGVIPAGVEIPCREVGLGGGGK